MSGFVVNFLRERRKYAIKMDNSDVSTEKNIMAQNKKGRHPGAPPKGVFRGGAKSEENLGWFQIDPAKKVPFDQFGAEFLRMIIFRAVGKELDQEEVQSVIDRIPMVKNPTPEKVGEALGLNRRRRLHLFTEIDIIEELKEFCENHGGEENTATEADLQRDTTASRSSIHVFPRKEHAVLDHALSDLVAMLVFRCAGDELPAEAVIECIHEMEPVTDPNLGKIEKSLNVTSKRLRNMLDHLTIRSEFKLLIKERRLAAKAEEALNKYKERLKNSEPGTAWAKDRRRD